MEPHFQPTSQFPPKNTYHMHTGLFFSSCVTVIYVTYPKNILQPHFHGSSRLKKNFHSHKGPFFSSRVTIICVKYPKNILQPRFHAGPTYPLYYCHENNSLASRIETCQSRLWKKITNHSGASSFIRRPETSRPNLIA